MKLPTMTDENAEKMWKSKAWPTSWRRSCHEGAAIDFEMTDFDLVEKHECRGL